jgi:hypothetical protein
LELKINIDESPDEQRWSLQGRLVGQWADELRSTWRQRHCDPYKGKCIVTLTDVTFIDRNGEAVLAEMMDEGATFIANDVYTKHLLKRLRTELDRSRGENERKKNE